MTILNNPKKTVRVIKNTHTKAQLDEMSNRFNTHKGPFLSLKQILEKETQQGFKKLKTYTAEEIFRAGGTTNFAILTEYNTKDLYKIKGELLSDTDFNMAITTLSK